MFTTLAVTTSAIDTPWLPLNPDGATTTQEEMKADGEKTDSSVESTKDSANTNIDISDEDDDIAAQPSDSENTSDEESDKSGCGSVIGMCTVLITSVSVAMVCTKKQER